jgi:hypothetical protein
MAGVSAEIQIDHLSNTSPGHYRNANPLSEG